jgi:hypothetical protein
MAAPTVLADWIGSQQGARSEILVEITIAWKGAH